jgi:hypothetical protein
MNSGKHIQKKAPGVSLIADDLIKILLYFDVFSYPLTIKELISYAGSGPGSEEAASYIINDLRCRGVINHFKGYYFIGDRRYIVERRIDGNRRAVERMRTAIRYSRIISYFPFVRGVFLSGSISKGYMGESDDIDYFIVTAPGRLWVAHTLLTLFKKVFLLNSYRNFCINYFVDSDHLFISEQNRYTASEIVFLIPVYNQLLFRQLVDENSWVKFYYPCFEQSREFSFDNFPRLKKWTEKLLGNFLGDRLENYCYKYSGSYIRKKFKGMDPADFSSNFSIMRHELRYLPNRQQFRILEMYNDNILKFERETGMAIKRDSYVTTGMG